MKFEDSSTTKILGHPQKLACRLLRRPSARTDVVSGWRDVCLGDNRMETFQEKDRIFRHECLKAKPQLGASRKAKVGNRWFADTVTLNTMEGLSGDLKGNQNKDGKEKPLGLKVHQVENSW